MGTAARCKRVCLLVVNLSFIVRLTLAVSTATAARVPWESAVGCVRSFVRGGVWVVVGVFVSKASCCIIGSVFNYSR